jgi:hypothetical protein
MIGDILGKIEERDREEVRVVIPQAEGHFIEWKVG